MVMNASGFVVAVVVNIAVTSVEEYERLRLVEDRLMLEVFGLPTFEWMVEV